MAIFYNFNNAKVVNNFALGLKETILTTYLMFIKILIYLVSKWWFKNKIVTYAFLNGIIKKIKIEIKLLMCTFHAVFLKNISIHTY